MTTPAIGLTLQPDRDYLERLYPLFARDVDLFEVAPETTWRLDPETGELAANAYQAVFHELGTGLNKPFVAHGVAFSLGTAGDGPRRRRWLTRLAHDQKLFNYRWYTDHLGASALAGLALTLPIGLPMTPAAIAVVRARLADMRTVVPAVGLENSAIYFVLGDPLAEPAFIDRILGDEHHLLLDLHNVHTMATNLGFDPEDYLTRLDLARVRQIHLAGGRASDPAWLPSRRALHLDSHDAGVPEAVWRLLGSVLPRCPGLEAVVLERMEGTLEPGDERLVREELRRARRLVARAATPRVSPPAREPSAPPPASADGYAAHEAPLAAILLADDPAAALARAVADEALDPGLREALRAVDLDGLRISALFVARLRFERLLQGDADAAGAFDADPGAFSAEFRRYHHEVPPTAFFPQDEAVLYRRWRAG